MRVLHIIPCLAQGGAEKVLADVVTHVKGSHAVVLLEDLPDFYKLPKHVRIYRLGIPTSGRNSRWRQLAAKVKFGLILLWERPQTVVGFSYVGHVAAAKLARYLGIRAVWSLHFPISDAVLDDADNAPRMKVYAELASQVSAIHYPSNRTREVCEARGIVSNGVVIKHRIEVAS